MNKLSVREKVIYGVGAFGYGAVNQTFGNFLMFFGTAFLGLSGTLMGLAISISTVWDAVTDPIVGTMNDRGRSGRVGRRQTYMLAGAIGIAVINIAIWSVPRAWGETAKFFTMLFTLLAVETFNTVYSTPYSALGVDMASNYDDRTGIQSYKTAFAFSSLLVPSVLIALGYIWISVVTSILCIFTALVTIYGTKKYRGVAVPPPEKSKVNFFAVVKLKNVGVLMLGYTISLLCIAVVTTLGMHVFTYSFNFSEFQIPLVMLCLIVGVVAGQPIWCTLSRRIDKKNTVLCAIYVILAGVALFAVLLSMRGLLPRGAVLALVCPTIIIISAGIGCLATLPVSMFADCLYIGGGDTAPENTATAMGFMTLCTKLSNAVIMFFVGVTLDVIGFSGGGRTQTPFVANMLGTVLVAGVALSCIFAWFFYSKYTYTKKDVTI